MHPSDAEEERMFTLEQFVEDCRAALQEKSPQSAVKDLVTRAVADAPTVERPAGHRPVE